ncbi:MAG: hypothetical protein F9B45_20765 [Phycisphaera sp. RhM]|nr:hypothetical protein [Phycisphaera sp. RhM]
MSLSHPNGFARSTNKPVGLVKRIADYGGACLLVILVVGGMLACLPYVTSAIRNVIFPLLVRYVAEDAPSGAKAVAADPLLGIAGILAIAFMIVLLCIFATYDTPPKDDADHHRRGRSIRKIQ